MGFEWVIVALGSGLAAYWLATRKDRKRAEVQAIASDLGLSVHAGDGLRGVIDGLHLSVEDDHDGTLLLTVLARSNFDVQLAPRPFNPLLTVKGEWDLDFERLYIVKGNPDDTLCVLGPEVRGALTDLASRRWTLRSKQKEAFYLEAKLALEFQGELRKLIDEALMLGRLIASSIPRQEPAEVGRKDGWPRPIDFPRVLIDRLADPSSEVRRRIVQRLGTLMSGVDDTEIRAALRRALTDSSLPVRVEAAIQLEDAKALIGEIHDPAMPNVLKIKILNQLFELESREPPVGSEEGHRDLPGEIDRILESWALGENKVLRLEAVDALDTLGHKAEHWLLQALTRAEAADEEEVIAAIFGALKDLGTTAAVPRLQPYRDRVLPSRLKTAAIDTTLAIQSRADVEAGRLSLTHGAGGLSEPE